MITYHPDDPIYANDLSFMTDEDWIKYNEIRKAKESAKDHLDRHNNP